MKQTVNSGETSPNFPKRNRKLGDKAQATSGFAFSTSLTT